MSDLVSIARPYAKAAFSFAVDQNDVAKWQAFLQQAQVIVADAQVKALLQLPSVGSAHVKTLLMSLCSDFLDTPKENFLALLAQNRRFAVLPDVYKLFEQYSLEAKNEVKVHVTYAMSISDEQKAALKAALEKRLNKTVLLECQQDDALIGGMKITADGLVIDGSLMNVLSRMSRAVHV